MTDDELISAFQGLTLSPDTFTHREHVRLAWLYLVRRGILAALTEFSADLRAFAANLGKPGLYHETITWGHLFLIHERIAAAGRTQTWYEFEAENPDLLDWKTGTFIQYYGEAVIDSPLARKVFVLPRNRVAQPGKYTK